MVRVATQLLVGLMLFFAVLTLFPKAYIDFNSGKRGKALRLLLLGIAAAFFSLMAFYHVYLGFTH